jgi:hypothetical protein
MNINLTFVVQIIHTIIAYGIIERLLLRPLFAAYSKDKRHKQNLLDNVDQSQEALRAREREQHKQWQGLQNAFKRKEPRMPLAIIAQPDSATPRIADVSAQHVQQVVTDLKPIITKRLIHD